MDGVDEQGARADDVADVANDEGLVGGEVEDAPAVLQGLGVAKGDDAGDFGFDGVGEGLDGAVGEGGALAVEGLANGQTFVVFGERGVGRE